MTARVSFDLLGLLLFFRFRATTEFRQKRYLSLYQFRVLFNLKEKKDGQYHHEKIQHHLNTNNRIKRNSPLSHP